VRLSDYLTFLRDKAPSGLPALTAEVLRKGWLHAVPEAYSNPTLDPSGLWARRVGVLRAHFRSTMQIAEPFRAAIRPVEPLRSAVPDDERTTRGASPVFQDSAEWISWRATNSKTANDGPEAHLSVRNRYAAREGGGGVVDATIASMVKRGGQAPALVTVI